MGLAIFGLLAVMAVNFGRSSLQRASFSSTVNTFLADFSSIKQQAATENRYLVLDFNAGGTGYVIRRQKNPCRYPAWAWKVIQRILDWLLENRAEAGLFRYPGGLPGMPPSPILQ